MTPRSDHARLVWRESPTLMSAIADDGWHALPEGPPDHSRPRSPHGTGSNPTQGPRQHVPFAGWGPNHPPGAFPVPGADGIVRRPSPRRRAWGTGQAMDLAGSPAHSINPRAARRTFYLNQGRKRCMRGEGKDRGARLAASSPEKVADPLGKAVTRQSPPRRRCHCPR